MTQAVDDAGRRHGDPQHLHRPHGDADGTEQNHVESENDVVALTGVPCVDIALQPVVRRAVTVALESLRVTHANAIELGALEQQLADAVDLRAVRIFLGLDLGVVLAMHRDPLPGHLARGQPQPHAEKVRDDGMQIQGAMGHGAMQIDGYRGDGNVRRHQSNRDVAPDGKFQ